jgi:hypothetical protein
MKEAPLTQLQTRAGIIPFPAYIPVTTFGDRYPLDQLVRPYLSRLASAVMVSLHYARPLAENPEQRPRLPVLVDSGGFASLFDDARISEENGLGVLERIGEEQTERLHPCDVLEFQEQHADVAFTLDFPIPPKLAESEGARRLELTVANAHWALANRRRRDLALYASVQGWDVESYRRCAAAFAGTGFDGIAIGGLIPRAKDRDLLFGIVDAVRAVVPGLPLHVFGIGQPNLVAELFEHGVQSVDSSAYVQLAAQGRAWGATGSGLLHASPSERLHLALHNLATACKSSLPLSARGVAFNTKPSGSYPSAQRSDQTPDRIAHPPTLYLVSCHSRQRTDSENTGATTMR